MKFEEYGKENDQIIIMLHGAHMVHTFKKQYVLAKQYHIIVPHIMGFGNNTEQIFETENCIKELVDFIKTLNKKVYLVGFSFGAQIAFKLVSEHENLFEAAVIVSAWLIKEEPFLSEIMKQNEKQLKALQNKFLCSLTGIANGLSPKQCREFVMQMQNVKAKTVHNMVYNGITLENVPEFISVSIPVITLAGEKEQKEITDAMKIMSDRNPNFRYQIWDKAGHSIPISYPKKFNKLLDICLAEGFANQLNQKGE